MSDEWRLYSLAIGKAVSETFASESIVTLPTLPTKSKYRAFYHPILEVSVDRKSLSSPQSDILRDVESCLNPIVETQVGIVADTCT